MIAMNPSVDTKPADYYDGFLSNMSGDIVADKATTGLRLQRTKPRPPREGTLTLDNCFGLKRVG